MHETKTCTAFISQGPVLRCTIVMFKFTKNKIKIWNQVCKLVFVYLLRRTKC